MLGHSHSVPAILSLLSLIVFFRYLMDGAESSSESEAEQDESEEETQKTVIALSAIYVF